jgi:LysM repeat protein
MKRLIWMLAGMILQCWMYGQADVKMSRDDYISTFADLAMREMSRTGIPASITLAQGCLESDNGNSRLAVRGNNHFGIKCHEWEGKRIHQNDDSWRECFRSYPSVYESYMDHSQFLTSKPRYAALFQLDPGDYRGWARGLKDAGYATAPDYARKLIGIIEEYQLYHYDHLVLEGGAGDEGEWMAGGGNSGVAGSGSKVAGSGSKAGGSPVRVDESGADDSRPVLVNNRIEYIVVRPGDTPESLRDELDLYRNEIYRYNNLSRGEALEPGEIIYLQPKRRKAARGNEIHVVEEGQTMEDISRIYGVKLKHLYRMNLMTEGEQPSEGTELYLRKKKHEPFPDLERPGKKEPSGEPQEKVEMEFRFDDG